MRHIRYQTRRYPTVGLGCGACGVPVAGLGAAESKPGLGLFTALALVAGAVYVLARFTGKSERPAT